MADPSELLQNLADLEEEELEAQLGKSAQNIGEAVARGETKKASTASTALDIAVERGPVGDALKDAGQRMFDWISPAAYKLLCTPLGGEGADETMKELVKLLDEDLGKNVVKAAGMLTPFLTANLGLAPAIAALVSTLIIKRVSKGVAKFTCDAWQKSLESPAAPETVTAPEAPAGA
jgi:hypothetical protein